MQASALEIKAGGWAVRAAVAAARTTAPGAAGCGAAGATGHLTGTFEKTVTEAGKIICGVGHEFPPCSLGRPTTRRARRTASS